MMFIKAKIFASIRGSIRKRDNVKELLKAIHEQFESSNKALASTLMTKLSSMKLTSVKRFYNPYFEYLVSLSKPKKANGYAKAIGCKYVFKTKKDSLGNIERYKAILVAKGFTQKEGINYMKTFSPISKIDSLHVIMALVAHFNLELHQMDVKIAFLNGNLEEKVYMKQPERFSSSDGEHLVCKLNKSIYGLTQASHQWYLKFYDVCTRLEIAFVVGMLGRYQSNPSMDHWKGVKKVMRDLKGTKDYMLMYRRIDNLEVVGYLDSDFTRCVDSQKSTPGYVFMFDYRTCLKGVQNRPSLLLLLSRPGTSHRARDNSRDASTNILHPNVDRNLTKLSYQLSHFPGAFSSFLSKTSKLAKKVVAVPWRWLSSPSRGGLA
ncbi:Cysteine-rich RLK (RECEPTOR-like protein kinase) 8 [Theobroma cacao]|uniref:Cysteine-rich RLK (RECEPTOR-like protein kinase) 8 n=1 Tax=Theobroma cacao TaxID=3641 RepID=A0A061F679_THECC|nr:Cysteine-rich RLK (RECEPTOR-like protein kinase) 8 [Theobroma cacao]